MEQTLDKTTKPVSDVVKVSEETTKDVKKTWTDPVTGKFVVGNPGGGGRKGSRHFSTLLMEVLKEQVELKGLGKMSLDRAMSLAISRKAVRGDVSAFTAITNRVDGLPSQSIDMEVSTPPVPIYNGKSRPKKV